MNRRSFLSLIPIATFSAMLQTPSIKWFSLPFKKTKVEEYGIRSRLWSEQIKQLLLEELQSMEFKNVIIDNRTDDATKTDG